MTMLRNNTINSSPRFCPVLTLVWAKNALLSGFVLWSLLISTAYAQTDAYSLEVAVADRGSAEQQDAYQAAFRRVLINNSGDKTLLNRDAIRAGLLQAESFVASFSYRTPPPGTVISSDTPITELVRETGQATQLMLVSFDRARVRELIDGSAGSQQPQESDPVVRRSDTALVWLLIQDAGRDIMISDPAAANVQSRAREIAGASGISLVFPAGDATDQSAVAAQQLLEQDYSRILEASARYELDTVLIGTLTRDVVRGWQGEWSRFVGTEQQQASLQTGSLDEALQQGLTLLSREGQIDESYRYGGAAVSDTEGLVWVGSVNSLADYAALMAFMESVPAVGTVYPKEISDTAMVFAVLPRGALRDIESAVVSQAWLNRTSPPFSDANGSLARDADLALEFAR